MMRSAIIAALALSPVLACAQQESCPLLLPEGAVEVRQVPAGWVAGPKSLVRITSAGVMSRHPEQMAYMVPASERKIKGGHVTTYEFAAGEEKWLWCEYGTPAIQIAKRMGDAATKCELTAKEERRGVYTEVKATCK